MPARLTPLSGGAPILLDKPIILIGRHPDCDVVIANSAKVSRRHCCVAQINDAYFVRDLGSMNGVRVNGTRVTQAVLNPNDQLAIGDVPYVFQPDAIRAVARPAPPPIPGVATNPPAGGLRPRHPPPLFRRPDTPPILLRATRRPATRPRRILQCCHPRPRRPPIRHHRRPGRTPPRLPGPAATPARPVWKSRSPSTRSRTHRLRP